VLPQVCYHSVDGAVKRLLCCQQWTVDLHACGRMPGKWTSFGDAEVTTVQLTVLDDNGMAGMSFLRNTLAIHR
jgi:hypothetical protein